MKKLFKKQKLKYIIPSLIVMIIVAIMIWGMIKKNSISNLDADDTNTAKKTAVSDRTYQIKRDDLPIGILQGGSINASEKHKLALQANFNTKLLWIIDENSWVKAGDELIRFETDELKKRIEDYEIDLDNLIKELEIAIEEEKILDSTNAADMQAAEDKVQQAQDALKKYRRIERMKTINSHEESIKNAEAAVTTAEEDYRSVRDAEPKAAESSNGVQQDADEIKRKELIKKQQTIDSKRNALNDTEANRRAWRHYDHPNKMMTLANNLEQADLNLRRVRISINSKIIQKKRQIDNYRKRIKMTTTHLERHRSYMEMMVIKAPVDGVVIYSDPDMVWGRTEIKVGMDIGKGMTLITIPEMSNLIVDFDLPEEYRSKLKIGDVAVISPDSLPGTKFSGKISQIATLPVNLINWDSSSPKVYKAKIKFDKQSPLLVNGMSVQINVVTKTIKDTIFVPVEAIFENNERFFVYKNTITGVVEKDVKIGESSDNFVQILEGLDDGDVVYLYRPYQGKQGDK